MDTDRSLHQTNVFWIDLVQNLCLVVFAADFVLHLALVVMLPSFGVIAIPNGILTVSGMNHYRQRLLISCHKGGDNRHFLEAIFCHKCGEVLRQE